MDRIIVYDASKGAVRNDDFQVSVRVAEGEWKG